MQTGRDFSCCCWYSGERTIRKAHNVYDPNPQRNLDAAREVVQNLRLARMPPHEADVAAVLGGLPGTNGADLRQMVAQAASRQQSPGFDALRQEALTVQGNAVGNRVQGSSFTAEAGLRTHGGGWSSPRFAGPGKLQPLSRGRLLRSCSCHDRTDAAKRCDPAEGLERSSEAADPMVPRRASCHTIPTASRFRRRAAVRWSGRIMWTARGAR